MAGILRSSRALKRVYKSFGLSFCQLSRQEISAGAQACKQRGQSRLFSSGSPQGSNPVHEIGEKGKAGIPTWGYVGIGAGAGAVYYLYKNRQKADAESARDGSDRFTPPKQAACPPAVTPVNPPVPIPDFQGVETMEGTPMSLDDLLGDFAVVVTVDAKDPEVAQQVLDRLLQVIEGIDQKTNMQYTTPLVVDHTGDQKGKGRESGSRLKQLINEFLEKVKSKKDKTEARFKGLAGEDATKKVKEAISSVASSNTNGNTSSEGDKAADVPPILAAFGKGNMHLVTPEGTIVIAYEEAAVPEDIAESAAQQILDYKRSHPEWHGPKAVKGRYA